MMAQFSPLTRRIVALGIAVLALFGLVNLVLAPIYSITAGSLSGLEDARFQKARLESIAARPPLPRSDPVPQEFYLGAPDRQSASDALIAAIGASAARYEIQIDSVTPESPEPGRAATVSATVVARGEQDKMLAWINDLERGTPAVYFASWSLAAQPDGAVPAAEGAPAVPSSPTGGPLILAFNGSASIVWEPRS